MDANNTKVLLVMVAAVAVVAAVSFSIDAPKREEVAPDPQPRAVEAPREEATEPVSPECSKLVATAEAGGLIRPGTIDRSGGMILTDARWTALPAADQTTLAECVSHYVAGAQNRWITKLTFKNQATGVVYGTIEGTRYRVSD